MLYGVKRPFVLFVEHILAYGHIESFELLLFDLLSAFFLKPAQLGRIFLSPAMQARFLELQIAELFLEGEMSLELDHRGAEREVVIVERFGELDAALCIDGHLETRDASEAPGRVGDGLDQIGFTLADGLELVLVSAEMALVFGGIIRWEKDGAAGEGGFDGIQRCRGFAFLRLGTSRELGVGAVRTCE